MNLILLGSGNAATQFGNAFRRAGFRVVQIFSRTLKNGLELAKQLDSEAVSEPEKIDASRADAVISALRDSAAADVWSRIRFGNTPVFHTAGSMPMDALAPFAVNRGVLYPLQTLTKKRILDFRQVPLYIEFNSPETGRLLHTIASAISDHVREVDSEQRRSIHIAAVFANNFSNHMFTIATQLLERNGLNFADLLPLIDETARKVHELPPLQSQTGPAIRYDVNIIRKHLDMLKDYPEAAAIYDLLSRDIHRVAEEKKN